MKKTFKNTALVFIIILLSSFTIPNINKSSSNALFNTVEWMTFEEAIAAAKADKEAGKTPKKMFVDVYTDWCGWCKVMDEKTFQVPMVAKYLNENFYPVKFNAEQKEDLIYKGKTLKFVKSGRRGYHELASGLLNGKMSYPSVVFLDEDADIITTASGYIKVDRFDVIMRYIGDNHYKDKTWEVFQSEYKAE